MGQQQDVIEINGKKYDALTGQLLHERPTEQKKSETTAPAPVIQKTGVVLDGFVRPKKTATHSRNASHVQKTPQHSQTLMRSAVKKPQSSAPESHAAKPEVVKSSLKPSHHLVHKASEINKSPLVSHYGDVQHRSSVIKKTAHMPVKAPEQAPVIQQVIHAAEEVKQHIAEVALHSHSSSEKLVQKALATATSHEQLAHEPHNHHKKHRKLAHRFGVSPRAMAVSTSVLAGVLLGGFFAIQNVPNLSMRVAAARAGVNASMPGYQPSGFSFKGPIDYSAGQVTVSFRSNTDDRAYSVAQRSSNWNSDALLSNFVVAEGKQYQTYIDRGRTLYIYDGSNATWVDNGVWYQVEGNSDMTTDQLVRIAASI